MEQSSKIPSIGDARDIFGKDRNAWKILPLNGLYHPSTDASLFSSSLPVLPHEKLNHVSFESAGDTVDSSDKIEGIEPIGSLLPGDEEELLAGIMDDFDLNELPTHLEDLDDDIFGSGGGLEMESEAQESVLNGFSHLGLSDSILGNNTGQYGFPNGVGTVAGEHPYGEHPSRTLFVRNINSNVEDSELKLIFEQYGDIRTLYTACKHRGFVMISYYDIRAARTAIRALQNKPLRRRRLDIHFSIPKDNPSEKDVNQGTLVVFNLDASVSNDDLRQIFGAYGEIKEIRETPNKRHHKFIEFYDVRAADAALKALNRCDIAGKRIKLEPSRPGGARRNLMQQLTQELEHDEAWGFTFRHQVGSPLPSSPPGCWPTFSSPVEQHSLHGLSQSPGLGTYNPATRHQVGSLLSNSPPGCWPTFGSPIEQHSLHSLSQSPGMGTISSVTSNHLAGLASVLPNHLSTSGKFAPIGKEPGRMLSSSPVPVSPLGDLMSKSPNTGRLSGSQFLWGSPTVHSENASSSSWSTTTMGHPYAPSRQVQSPVVCSRQPSLLGSHHYVGSAPSGVPLDRQFGFLHESPEISYMSQVAFGNAGLSPTNGNHAMNIAPMNFGVAFAGNFAESGSPSRVMSLARNGPILGGNGSYGGLGSANLEAFSRNRRVENGNQVDNKKQYQLDLEKIRSGEDIRTTLMIKNIPNKYTSKMLLAAIDESHQGTYDFLYLPIDFKNKCNVGYAFINMVSPSHIVSFYEVFNGKKWEKFNSEKVASLAYARIQGKNALVAHFQNSSLMNEDKRCRPILFQSEGEDLTDQELFHSSNLNICIRQPDGSYSGDSLESPKGYFDEKLENTSTSF